MITTRTALLLALREGPGYGRGLVRRIQQATESRLRFAEGSIYPALRGLARAGLVSSWTVVPGRRRGDRGRTYYELSEKGVRVSERERGDILRIAGAADSPPPMPDEVARMRRRIELGAELSDSSGAVSLHAPRRRGRRA